MIIIYACLIFLAWCLIGDTICYIYEKWSMRTIYEKLNYNPESFSHEARRDISLERGHIPNDVTEFDIVYNTIFWPRTLIHANRGHKKFIAKHTKQESAEQV